MRCRADHGDCIVAIVSYKDVLAVRRDGNSNRAISHCNGRTYNRVRGRVDLRNRSAVIVRNIGILAVRSDRHAKCSTSHRNGRTKYRVRRRVNHGKWRRRQNPEYLYSSHTHTCRRGNGNSCGLTSQGNGPDYRVCRDINYRDRVAAVIRNIGVFAVRRDSHPDRLTSHRKGRANDRVRLGIDHRNTVRARAWGIVPASSRRTTGRAPHSSARTLTTLALD